MDLSRPHAAVAPQVGGDVLVALAGTTGQMTGRHIARVVRRGSRPAVTAALEQLVAQGIVLRTDVPPAHLYSLNREHVAYPAVAALANTRPELLARLKGAFESWAVPPVHASLFGSAARADGDTDSDIDIFLVRPRSVDEEDATWQRQTDELSTAVAAWTGNPLSLIEFSDKRVMEMTRDALAPMLDDGVLLWGTSLSALREQTHAA